MLRNSGIHALDRRACLRLLAGVPVGRVVYTEQVLPAVLPVSFRLDTDSCVLLRTSADAGLVRAVDGAVVAFEADEFDAATRCGWSVVVTGRATVVTDSETPERPAASGPDPRAAVPVPESVLVRIASEMITGRRLTGPSQDRAVI
ncbi:pyridoxamine 5'-phosphate oxidase family protein [Streptomyces sp. NPDC006739]|uniref:pyridoxamine 5'-phosphate oxidase family protein n=1 Tax=Streptomyces sp. NPDC006739 TaxID=3364763 RepID=UPI0036CD8974